MGYSEVCFYTNFFFVYIILGQLYNPVSAFPITTDTLPEPHSPQPLFPRNATANVSTSASSDQSLLNIIPPIILGVFGGIFTVGCFVVSVKQYRRSDTSRLEELIIQTILAQSSDTPTRPTSPASTIESEQNRDEPRSEVSTSTCTLTSSTLTNILVPDTIEDEPGQYWFTLPNISCSAFNLDVLQSSTKTPSSF